MLKLAEVLAAMRNLPGANGVAEECDLSADFRRIKSLRRFELRRANDIRLASRSSACMMIALWYDDA